MKASDLTGIAVFFFVLLLVVVSAQGWPELNGDSAAWIQAAGGLLGVAAAILIGLWQSRTTMHSVISAQQLATLAKQQAIFAVIAAGKQRADNLSLALDAREPRVQVSLESHDIAIGSIIHALSSIPAHEISSAEGVGAFLLYRDQYSVLQSLLRRLLDGPYANEDLARSLRQHEDTPEGRQNRAQQVQRLETIAVQNLRMIIEAMRKPHGVLQAKLLQSTSTDLQPHRPI